MKMHTLAHSLLMQSLFLLICTYTVAAQSRSSMPTTDQSASENEERFGSSIREMTQRSHFENRALSSNDLKSLEKLEKIARRIRSYAGGSDDESEIAAGSAMTLGDSLSQIAELSSSLQQEVEKTARQVVSAKLIADANRFISLVRQARAQAR